MEKLIETLEQHYKQNLPNCENEESVLDTLYWHYTECYTMTNEKTKQASRNLNAYLRFLPPKKRDAIYCLASTLCAEHESIAFIAGLQLGAQLMLELQQSDEN